MPECAGIFESMRLVDMGGEQSLSTVKLKIVKGWHCGCRHRGLRQYWIWPDLVNKRHDFCAEDEVFSGTAAVSDTAGVGAIDE